MKRNNYYGIQLTNSLDNNIGIIKGILGNDKTIIYREFLTDKTNGMKCCIVIADGMVDKHIVNESIIRPILESNIKNLAENEMTGYLIDNILTIGDIQKSKNLNDIISGILYGKTILFSENCDESLIIDTIGWEKRSIVEPQSETIVRGPREGFTESISVNISLIRRRILNPNLKLIFMVIGTRTKTKICICYLEGVAKELILNELITRLKGIKIDGIMDSGYIEELIKDAPYSPLRTLGSTERPDVAAAKVLEGRFAIICDGSPTVLTLPKVLIESFQSDEDYFNNYIFASFTRLLRWVGFFLTTSVPAVYVAIITYHQELLPTPLLLSIAASRHGVPFPSFVEAIGMVIIFEILKEAGLRMPKYLGQAVSIVGTLVLGEAAVNAKLVSAPIVTITAITGISSFMMPQDLAVIPIRIIFLLVASILGLYGYIFAAMALTLHLYSLRSFGVPFMLDIPAFSYQEMKDTFIRAPWWDMYLRPNLIAKDKKRVKNNKG